MSIKLPTYGSFTGSKFLVTKTADLGSFDGTFQQGYTFGQQTADLCSFDGTFQQNSKVSIILPTSGNFNGAKVLVTQTADLGSFIHTFFRGYKLPQGGSFVAT